MEGYNVVSCFDGIACALQTLKQCGVPVNRYYALEIDQRAIKVAKSNHPEIIHYGDITKVKPEHFMTVPDLICGGSPCQGFSFAGKQLNFDDPRSKLFWEFVRLYKAFKEINPEILFFLENVRMVKESEDVITQALGVSPQYVNSSIVSGANRQRLYWTNISGFEMPADRNIKWKDIQQCGSKSGFYSDNMLRWIFKDEKRKATFQTYTCKDNCKMQMLEASHHKGASNQRNFGILDNGRLRYIIPSECELLQGLPIGYTKAISTSGRLHALGNGWQIDTIELFFKHIPKIKKQTSTS